MELSYLNRVQEHRRSKVKNPLNNNNNNNNNNSNNNFIEIRLQDTIDK